MFRDDLAGLRVVVLAAGISARMGSPKALLRIRGLSLIQRTVAVLTHCSARRIIVVTAPRALRLGAELRGSAVSLLANPQRARGLSSSVRRGLRETRYAAATLFLPLDLGELQPGDIALLISRWRAAKRRVTARRLGGHAATPLILPKWLYARALCLAGDVGLRALTAALPTQEQVLVDLPSADHDIDTPYDLISVRRRYGPVMRFKRSRPARRGAPLR